MEALDPEVTSTIGVLVVIVLMVWLLTLGARIGAVIQSIHFLSNYDPNQRPRRDRRTFFVADAQSVYKHTLRTLTMPSLPREDVPVVRLPMLLHTTGDERHREGALPSTAQQCVRVNCDGEATVSVTSLRDLDAMSVLSGRVLLFASFTDLDEFVRLNVAPPVTHHESRPRNGGGGPLSLAMSNGQRLAEDEDEYSMRPYAALHLTGSGYHHGPTGPNAGAAGDSGTFGEVSGSQEINESDTFVGGIVMRVGIDPTSGTRGRPQAQKVSFDLTQEQAEQIVMMSDEARPVINASPTSQTDNADVVVPMVWLLRCMASATINASASSEADVITLVYLCDCVRSRFLSDDERALMARGASDSRHAPSEPQVPADNDGDSAAVAGPLSATRPRLAQASPSGVVRQPTTPQLGPCSQLASVSPAFGRHGNFEGSGTSLTASDRDADPEGDTYSGPEVFSAISDDLNASNSMPTQRRRMSPSASTDERRVCATAKVGRRGQRTFLGASVSRTDPSSSLPPPHVPHTAQDVSLEHASVENASLDGSILIHYDQDPGSFASLGAKSPRRSPFVPARPRAPEPLSIDSPPAAGAPVVATGTCAGATAAPVAPAVVEEAAGVNPGAPAAASSTTSTPTAMRGARASQQYIDVDLKLYAVIFRGNTYKTKPIYYTDAVPETPRSATPPLTPSRRNSAALSAQPSGTFETTTMGQPTRSNHSDTDETDHSVMSVPDQDKCIVCYARRACVVLVPCGHFGMCGSCVLKVNGRCPECRQQLQHIITTGPAV
jgi:hypothetical protein